MTDDKCPSPECRIDLIRCLNKKVSKNYLGLALGIIVAAASTVAYLTYDAYDNARDAIAAETVKAKALAEANREGLHECRSNTRLIQQALETINERLKELKSDQREVNRKVLESLEELKDK